MKVLAAFWPFRQSRADRDAFLLLSTVTQISRQPEFFGDGRVADTLAGRLELMTLHACLAFIRMGVSADTEPLAQAFADKLFRQFDAGLREDGVGDLAVPKRMRRIAQSFYGRLKVYGDALQKSDDAALQAALVRNIFPAAAEPPLFAVTLAEYATNCARLQAASPVEALFRLDGWAPAPA